VKSEQNLHDAVLNEHEGAIIPDNSPFYTVEEAAEFLKVPLLTMYTLVKVKRVPSKEVRKRLEDS
jgi:excisionase family DNA binding protein